MVNQDISMIMHSVWNLCIFIKYDVAALQIAIPNYENMFDLHRGSIPQL